ncbi:Gfo/Idh/MocA family oxidoreductase [Pelagibacteraceae bacterium]|nr:Gfo/Idh/MocA family oxidoreductase [Pelagibacteraceae bacterium]
MINACVIGLSTIGLLHCRNLIKIKKTQLTHVFDYNSKLGNKISKKFRCKTSNNFENILKDKSIKLFIIASPTNTHEYYVKKLISHNKMIYCEKPILMNLNKLKSLVRKIKSQRIKFCVGLNRRFAKPYLKIKRQIQKRKISTIRIISRSANHKVKQSIRNGGLFMDKGIHFFDLACWLSSSKPKKIISIAKPLSSIEYLKNNDFSDAFVVIKFNNNIVAEFMYSRANKPGNHESVEVLGKNFSINSDKYFNKKTYFSNFNIKLKDSYYKCLKNFIYTNKENFLLEGSNAQIICDAALKSAKTGKEIKLNF